MPRTVTAKSGSGPLSGADPTDLIRDAVSTALRVYNALESLSLEKPSRHTGGGGRSVIVGSSPSWHAQAAYLVFELGPLARELEANLKLRVTHGDVRPRGSSSANTVLALQQVIELANLAVRDLRWDTWRRLDAWNLRGRTCLGEVEPLALLPRLPGKLEPRCPYCTRLTLRHQVLAAVVRCVNPVCHDDDGNRPVAYIVLGQISREPILTWRDGTCGLSQDDDVAAVA